MSSIALVTFWWAICKTKQCFSYKWPSSSAYFILVFRFKSFPLQNAGECRVPFAVTWHVHITQKCEEVFIDLECVLKPLYIIITGFISSWKYPACCDALIALLLNADFFYFIELSLSQLHHWPRKRAKVSLLYVFFFFKSKELRVFHFYLVH